MAFPVSRIASPFGKGLRRSETKWAYLLISPWIIGFVIFTLGPMIASLVLSFTKYDIVQSPTFVGFDNYIKLISGDPKFWHSLSVTVVYALVAVPLNLVFGFALAYLLNLKIPGLAFWRTVFYMPSVTAGVATALMWGAIFNPRYGALNWFLGLLGIDGPGWFASPYWALPALILISLWGVGGGMIIYLSGLQSIPTALYEAAQIDGANGWKQLRHITLPLMSPVIFYNLVIGIIGTFQYFTEAYVLTRGGPAEATMFYNLYLYNNAFSYRDMGYASALAWVLFLIVLVLTALVFKSSAAWVYYEGEVRR
ncbi:MAG TPA: sugar ABC transporter permease [Anaerolineaceae bacterium]|nr:sugar ABC transporter permease [Anaerolineaceae bacterium]